MSVAIVLAAVAGCGDSSTGPEPPGGGDEPPAILTEGATAYGFQVMDRHPHDPEAFTQGLVLDDGTLFEGTGLWGSSSLRRVDLETGAVLQRHDLDPTFFGEGITVFGDDIFQLTFTSGTGLVYDRETFVEENRFSYPTEGWGLTHDGVRLIMSDGSATLRFLDPASLEETGSVVVTDEGEPVPRLNELEYIEGHVFANVWLTDRVAVIDPADGEVASWIDLAGLLTPEERAETDVLNGIAVDHTSGRLLVTGKYWPWLFEIVLVPEA